MAPPRQVVLASASPRRRMLLEAACVEVEVCPSHADETWPGGSPGKACESLARKKLRTLPVSPKVMVAADTEVILDDLPLGKPKDRADAIAMLRRLGGREHLVVTGFCVARGERERAAHVLTRVWFRDLSDLEIAQYVDSGDPMDKAGAYGIQGIGGFLIDRLEGSYTNVMGLPLGPVLEAIDDLRGGR